MPYNQEIDFMNKTTTSQVLYALVEVRGQHFLVPYTNPAVLERYVNKHRVIIHEWDADVDASTPMCSLSEIDTYLA